MNKDIKKIMEEIGSNSKVAYERLSTASNEEKNDASLLSKPVSSLFSERPLSFEGPSQPLLFSYGHWNLSR